MSGLTEKYVQDVSLEFLKKYYEDKDKPEKIFCKKEVVTKYKKRKGRADGLIAYKNGNQIYTVSLEAKSHKTYDTLIAIYNDKLWLLIGFIVACIIFAFSIFLLWQLNWIIKMVISLSVGTLFGFAAMFLIDEKGYLNRHGIIEQVRRYPANERWIAFSYDAYSFFDKQNEHELKIRAKRYGIGIIIVSKSRKAYIELHAKASNMKGKMNFLKYYSAADSIEKSIN